MLEFAYRYVTTILEDTKIYWSHAKRSSVDAENMQLVIQCLTDQSFISPTPCDFLLDIAHQKNRMLLPLIKPYSGPPDCPQLPPEIPAEEAQAVSVSAKVGAPASLAGQRFTFQIPSSQPAGKSATPTMQKVLINPSLIGPKNILITINTVSPSTADPNPLKRKHEDDDDYNAL
ncbi:transcription initiation factor TFIID subunit 9-like [Melozone crissalis]|uniref:transcription initiation factor TFIID subunit 9-like n=1 Tax=Melozone crissalis TaxID=40204 RepID=UPI0023DCEA4F|nr:transcription initiation factor TFIID subunit 9-like [Melozone crissalis]